MTAVWSSAISAVWAAEAVPGIAKAAPPSETTARDAKKVYLKGVSFYSCRLPSAICVSPTLKKIVFPTHQGSVRPVDNGPDAAISTPVGGALALRRQLPIPSAVVDTGEHQSGEREQNEYSHSQLERPGVGSYRRRIGWVWQSCGVPGNRGNHGVKDGRPDGNTDGVPQALTYLLEGSSDSALANRYLDEGAHLIGRHDEPRSYTSYG